MSQVSQVTHAANSLQQVWNRVGLKTEQLAAQAASGDLLDGSFVQTVVQLKSLQLQAHAAGLVFKTLHDMADNLLTRPRM